MGLGAVSIWTQSKPNGYPNAVAARAKVNPPVGVAVTTICVLPPSVERGFPMVAVTLIVGVVETAIGPDHVPPPTLPSLILQQELLPMRELSP